MHHHHHHQFIIIKDDDEPRLDIFGRNPRCFTAAVVTQTAMTEDPQNGRNPV